MAASPWTSVLLRTCVRTRYGGLDREHELEIMERSLAMLQEQDRSGLARRQALQLVEEVQDLRSRIRRLQRELRRLADEELL